MSFSNFLIEVLCLYLQIFLPPSNRFAAPPSSEWTRLSDCLLGAECGVGESGDASFPQGIKASITRGVSGCRAQARLMCQAGHSFAFLPLNLQAQSNHKIIRKAQTGGLPSGRNPILLKALTSQKNKGKLRNCYRPERTEEM